MVVICLSTYNGTQFLQEQLKSLEAQTYEHAKITLVVRDDGSKDESYKLLKQFAAESSIHIELLEDRTNLGVKKSFELLMNIAFSKDAEYIMFCDQDDIWHPDKISKTLEKMKVIEMKYFKKPILIHTNLSVVDRDLVMLDDSFWNYQHINPNKDSLNRLILHNTVTGCTMMINRTLAEKIRNIPDEAIMHDWWITMVASAFGHIDYVNEPLISYRQHGQNDTGAKRYGWRYYMSAFFAKMQSSNKRTKLEKYIVQAKSFLEMYKEELDQDQTKLLETFVKLQEKNWIGRKMVLVRHNIFKNGIVRNIGLILFA